MEKCETCKFFHIGGVQGITNNTSRPVQVPPRGRCKRWPPVVLGPSPSVFPVVSADEWCGEYIGRAG